LIRPTFEEVKKEIRKEWSEVIVKAMR